MNFVLPEIAEVEAEIAKPAKRGRKGKSKVEKTAKVDNKVI